MIVDTVVNGDDEDNKVVDCRDTIRVEYGSLLCKVVVGGVGVCRNEDAVERREGEKASHRELFQKTRKRATRAIKLFILV
jgi:hypothetical protein